MKQKKAYVKRRTTVTCLKKSDKVFKRVEMNQKQRRLRKIVMKYLKMVLPTFQMMKFYMIKMEI